ncbi:MAG: rRNA pseudouridine synthase [Actinobacteria bacterium]|nr:rRNA pseudouridine synthase [Actinomycetota bacterium]
MLAAAGVASRRASEELIADGRVTVDGRVATLGDKADPTEAEIRVDGERVNVRPDLVYVALNKPQGVVTTADDPEGRPTFVDLVNLPQRLFPVGRLDKDTEGLLLLTNDGDLAHKLMHPSYEVPRVYLALIRGDVRRPTLDALRDGVELEDGPARPRSVRLVDHNAGRTLLEIVLTEGRNREVRRLVGGVGLMLERLARVGYGGVELGELRQGKWRFLTQPEIGQLFAAVEDGASGGPRRGREGRSRRGRR